MASALLLEQKIGETSPRDLDRWKFLAERCVVTLS